MLSLMLLLVVISLGFVVWPLGRSVAASDTPEVTDRNARNVALYQERLAELQVREQAGELDQAQAMALKTELDAVLVSDYDQAAESLRDQPWPLWRALALGLVLVAAGAATYWQLGHWQAQQLSEDYLQALKQGAAGSDQSAEADALLARMQALVAAGRGDADWQYIIARSCMNKGDYACASSAYGAVVADNPEDADMVAAWAQAVYLASGRQLNAQVQGLLDRALSLNPHQPTALGVVGIAAFEGGEYALAMQAWQKALIALPPDSNQAQVLQQGVAQIRSMLGAAAADPAADHAGATAATGDVASAAASATASVSVAVSIAGHVPARADQIVFIFARASEGPPMPLAVQRVSVAQLPATVILDDSTAMRPELRLSQYPKVQIMARLSASGQAIAGEGDWQSDVLEVRPAELDAALQLQISQPVSVP